MHTSGAPEQATGKRPTRPLWQIAVEVAGSLSELDAEAVRWQRPVVGDGLVAAEAEGVVMIDFARELLYWALVAGPLLAARIVAGWVAECRWNRRARRVFGR